MSGRTIARSPRGPPRGPGRQVHQRLDPPRDDRSLARANPVNVSTLPEQRCSLSAGSTSRAPSKPAGQRPSGRLRPSAVRPASAIGTAARAVATDGDLPLAATLNSACAPASATSAVVGLGDDAERVCTVDRRRVVANSWAATSATTRRLPLAAMCAQACHEYLPPSTCSELGVAAERPGRCHAPPVPFKARRADRGRVAPSTRGFSVRLTSARHADPHVRDAAHFIGRPFSVHAIMSPSRCDRRV